MNLFRRPTKSHLARHRRSFRLIVERLEDRMQPSGFAGLGAAAGFGVLGLTDTIVKSEHATVVGDVGVSQGGELKNHRHATITGNAVEYAAGEYHGHGSVGGVVVDPALIAQADADALAASAQAASLAPTQSFKTINKATTVMGNGGLNVININGDLKASLILKGTANDVFVVNVTGSLKLNSKELLGLADGVTADHVLYNFIGAHGQVDTANQTVVNGTLLAPHYNFSFDGVLFGELVGGGKSMVLHHGTQVNAVPFHSQAAPNPKLSGFAYFDANGDGVYGPDDAPIAGVLITLTGVDGHGNTVTKTTFTNDDGSYSFVDLSPGTYQVFESQPDGYRDGAETVGTVNGSSQGQVLGNDRIGNITLSAGDDALGYNFGELSRREF